MILFIYICTIYTWNSWLHATSIAVIQMQMWLHVLSKNLDDLIEIMIFFFLNLSYMVRFCLLLYHLLVRYTCILGLPLYIYIYACFTRNILNCDSYSQFHYNPECYKCERFWRKCGCIETKNLNILVFSNVIIIFM